METGSSGAGAPVPTSEQGSRPSAGMARAVRAEMGDTWRHDPNFLEKFFPLTAKDESQIVDIKNKLYNFGRSRWKGITPTPKYTASLTTTLLPLLNGALQISKLHATRKFFKTNKLKVDSMRETVTSPSIFLAGSGTEFANTGIDIPAAQYYHGIAPVEVRLQSSENTQGRGRLTVHAREIFADQENRRFLFGIVVTQQTITVFMFDHSGAIFSDPLDYHSNPDQFCALILGLASTDSVRIGFDSTIYREGQSTKVRTSQSDGARRTRRGAKTNPDGIIYTFKLEIFRFSAVVGKGTLCWLVEEDRTGDLYVIKDSWTAPEELAGQESEASLLLHAQRKGLVKGIAQIRHHEEIYVKDQAKADTVVLNRQLKGPADIAIERVHTRLVLSTYGKPLDEFSTRREFIWAFHDAVLAHRNLYERAGILHRDVSVLNILINAEGEEGDRGILIDLDSATRVGDGAPYSDERGVGTWLYKSRNVLQRGPHTYIDDLESFYYVFCFIVSVYQRPFDPVRPHPEDLEIWAGKHAMVMKHGWIACQPFGLTISDWFGEPFRNLGARLHAFFGHRNWEAREARENKQPPPRQIPSADYDEFIFHIRHAISELESQGDGPPSPQHSPNLPDIAAVNPENGSNVSEKPCSRISSLKRRVKPVSRPRRSTAKY